MDNITVHKNELYTSSYSKGVCKSTDGGVSWQIINTGIFPEVSDFSEWRGELYASTLGASVFKLDPISRNKWLSFSNGLSNLSANITSIAGNNNALIAGTLTNGLYDYLPANTTTWEERFLLGRIRPTEGVYDIITGNDSLFMAGSTGRFYMSTDNGFNWNTFGNILPSLHASIVNAKQALLLSRTIFDGVNFNTAYYHIKKDSFQRPFVNFGLVLAHFTYKLEIAGNRLWDAITLVFFTCPCRSCQELIRLMIQRLLHYLSILFYSMQAAKGAMCWSLGKRRRNETTAGLISKKAMMGRTGQ